MSEGAGTILKEPWHDLARQREGATFGIWVFLASELLFFGSLLLVYTVYRIESPQAFAAAAARETDRAVSGLKQLPMVIDAVVVSRPGKMEREQQPFTGRKGRAR